MCVCVCVCDPVFMWTSLSVFMCMCQRERGGGGALVCVCVHEFWLSESRELRDVAVTQPCCAPKGCFSFQIFIMESFNKAEIKLLRTQPLVLLTPPPPIYSPFFALLLSLTPMPSSQKTQHLTKSAKHLQMFVTTHQNHLKIVHMSGQTLCPQSASILIRGVFLCGGLVQG